jgi:hypothetical protein
VQDGGRTVELQHRIEPAAIADVAQLERAPFDGLPVTATDVVISDGNELRGGQRLAAVAAHIAGAARDQHRSHRPAPRPSGSVSLQLHFGGYQFKDWLWIPGKFGVVTFFCISGILISYLLDEETRRTGDIDVKNFISSELPASGHSIFS